MTLLGIYLCMSASVALGYVTRVQIERLQNELYADDDKQPPRAA